jgi:two-component system sensor histidine kinase DesK
MASLLVPVGLPRITSAVDNLRRVRVRLNEHQRSSRFLGLATAGVVTGSVYMVTIGVMRVAILVPEHALVAVVATAAYLPVHLWHLHHAARGTRPRGTGWSLATMAVIVGAVLPVVGVQWLGALYPLAASALLVLRPPWSIAAFAALLTVPAPVAFAFGEPGWAWYFTLGLAMVGLVLAVPVWLVAAVRDLQAARERLAEEAVIRERIRIEAELRQTLGTALEEIATTGDRALSTPEPTEHLRVVVAAARTTLSSARRLSAGWRHSPAHAELAAAVALLRAAGVDTQVRGTLPADVPEPQLATLRDQVARLLQNGAVRQCVVEVDRTGGVRVEVVG